ncbi:ATP-binding protein [Limnohabitans radicicola]|uniref:Virulence sensor protein BvgS n=1 Tax=Limnohabitans radicicola TaxID=2771427 RepID=A0A927FGH9_9BURK|nr:ATP-binding protein [Limnohabitans radicicola]MBD8050147.1 response regulator [Limnohabitans radicicola]
MAGIGRLWTLRAQLSSSLYFRQSLLATYLLAVSLTSLIFYLIPPGNYARNANLVFSLLTMGMLPLVRVRALFVPLIHLVTFLSLVLVTYISSQTGAINSSGLVWLNVLAVPVLLLQGPRPAVVWIVIVLTTILALLVGSVTGHLDSHIHFSQQAVPWAFMNQAMAMANLMLAVRLYDHLHEQQMQQLQERNAELQRTHEALLQAQAHKDEFVAAVGHELRTPMNAILGFNGVLRQELADRPEQVEVVDHIRRSTGHLLQVVNDILDFSQLQAGKLMLHLEDFELQSLMDEALQADRDKALEKGIAWQGTLDPVLPARVRADRQRLLQILRNLLGNALKFTTQGEVLLRIHAGHDRLNFEVRDTGRGIALDQQAHIFRRFEHADVQTTRAYGGTGLGLSICEKLVQLHGGQMGVRSIEGHGATFWFHVPLLAAHAAPTAPQSDETLPEQEALRILVVDDNAMNLMVARLQLQKCWPRAEIVTLDSAAKALALLDEQAFDVALVDMVMPDMDGMALTRQIRHQFPAITARMPIIALTANTNPVERQRCKDAGMDDVLDKPMDLQTLVRCVSRHVLKARA